MAEPRNATYEGIKVEVYNMELMGIHGELVEVYNCWHPELGRFRAYAKELEFHAEGFEQVRPIGLVTYEKALAFIKHNNVECFMTPEGVTAKGQGKWPAWCFGDERGDDLCDEELMAFPVINGMVDITPIKQWLGY